MIPLALAASALVLIPYEPAYDCLKSPQPGRPVVWIEVQGKSDIRWDGERISREQFESYLAQERAREPDKRDAFRTYSDDAGSEITGDIVRELKEAKIPFAKNCIPIP